MLSVSVLSQDDYGQERMYKDAYIYAILRNRTLGNYVNKRFERAGEKQTVPDTHTLLFCSCFLLPQTCVELPKAHAV